VIFLVKKFWKKSNETFKYNILIVFRKKIEMRRVNKMVLVGLFCSGPISYF